MNINWKEVNKHIEEAKKKGEWQEISKEQFDTVLKRLINTPHRTYKQIVEEGREERKKLGVKMITPKMRAMSREELLKYIEQRKLKNAKKHRNKSNSKGKENTN